MTRKWMIETAQDLSDKAGYAGDRNSFREIAVGLSAEQVETLRDALERGRWVLDDTITRQFATALALLPPKREPTLLEAAKAECDRGHRESCSLQRSHNGQCNCGNLDLRAAIAREEARKP